MSLLVFLLLCLSVVHQGMGDQPVEDAVTAKKVQQLGGWNEADPLAKDVQEAAQAAVKSFNMDHKRKNIFKLVSLHNVKVQVTDKINYKFDAVLVKTTCLKSENHDDLSHCTQKKKHLTCNFTVTFDAYSAKHEVNQHKCKKQIEKA